MTGSSHKKDGARGSDSTDGPSPDLRDRQADFFEEYFKKGAQFTRALIAENEQLRAKLIAAEARTELPSLALSSRQQRIEHEQFELACLFVAQGQLARARDAGEVLGVIAEILLNFVGADRFAIYASDSERVLRPLFAAEVELADLPVVPPQTLVDAFDDNEIRGTAIGTAELDDEPVLAFPLRCAGAPFGAIAVWRFLAQKTLAPIDERLFEVIADGGGSALESARIRAQAPRIAGRPDHYSGLALLLGLGGRIVR